MKSIEKLTDFLILLLYFAIFNGIGMFYSACAGYHWGTPEYACSLSTCVAICVALSGLVKFAIWVKDN